MKFTIIWNNMDSVFEWAAQDETGGITIFSHKPEPITTPHIDGLGFQYGYWNCRPSCEMFELITGNEDVRIPDWKESIQQRPKNNVVQIPDDRAPIIVTDESDNVAGRGE